MSPTAKKATVNISALIGAVMVVGGWAVRSVDHRYVHTDAFVAVQAGATEERIRDSSDAANRFARIDTSLAELVRACRKRGECT